MVHLENLIGGVSCIEAARGEYSAYRLVVYIIIIVAYFSSCARVNVFFRISSGFIFIRFHSSAYVLLRVQSFLGNSSFLTSSR